MTHPLPPGNRRNLVLAVQLLFLLSFLAPLQAQELSVSTLTGRVVTGLVEGRTTPLSGVVVTFGLETALTDESGVFRIRAGDGEELEFARLGYETLTLAITPAHISSGDLGQVFLAIRPILLQEITARAGARDSGLASAAALAIGSMDEGRLQELGTSTLAESLTQVEGVSVSRVGSWGSRPVIRGVSGERLAVLIDGNRVNRACTFGMDQGLSTVDPAMVERVEVLSGPGSTLFGSGNVGGVINVVTRRPRMEGPWGGEARLSLSSAVPGTRAGATVSRSGKGYALAVGLDGSSYGDYRSGQGTVEGSSFRDLTGDVKAELRPGEAHQLNLAGQYYAGRDIGWPMQPGAEIPEETRYSISADYGWQVGRHWMDALSLRGYFQKLDHYMTLTRSMPGQTTFVDALSYSNTSGGRAQFRLLPLPKLHLEVGTEGTRWFAEATRWMETTFANDGTGPARDPMEMSFRTWPAVEILDLGAFAQGEYRATETAVVSAGIRFDGIRREAEEKPTVTESIVTGNLGITGDLTQRLGYRISLGRGYRVPDPTELYGIGPRADGFLYQGNPDLETETSTNVEGSLSLRSEALSLSVTGFLNDFQDMVAPVLIPGDTVAGRPVRRYQNIQESRMKGVSTSFSLRLPGGLDLTARGTLTHGEDSATGDPLPAMPPLEGAFRLRKSREAGPFRWLEGEVEAAAEQDRLSPQISEVRTPAYAVLHLRSGLEVRSGTVTVGLENVFDTAYRSHLDPLRLLRPGRNFYLRYTQAF